MIEGHTIRTVLESSFRSSTWFDIHERIHGITAPGFLFGAGFAFAIATLRRWEFLTSINNLFLRRVWRVIIIILVGYVLHAPYYSLSKIIRHASDAEINTFLAFGILQCIGFTLLGLRILLLVVKEEKTFLFVSGFLVLGIIFGTSFIWNERVNQALPVFISQGLNGLYGSIFPLFPYAGYMILGVIVSWLFIKHSQNDNEDQYMKYLALSGIGLILFSLIISRIELSGGEITLPHPAQLPVFNLRLGILFLMMSGLWFFENHIVHMGRLSFWMPQWLIISGIESFFLYVIHLLVVYGWIFNPWINLRFFFLESLSILESISAFILLTILLVWLAKGWRYVKREHPVLMQGLYWWIGGTFTYYFLTNTY